MRNSILSYVTNLLAGEIFIFYFSKKLKINNLRKISSIIDLQIDIKEQKEYENLSEQYDELYMYLFMQIINTREIYELKWKYKDEDLIESVLEKNSILFSKFYELYYSHLNPFTNHLYRFNESEKNTIKINTKNLLKLFIKQYEYEITLKKYEEYIELDFLSNFYEKNNLTDPYSLIKFLSLEY